MNKILLALSLLLCTAALADTPAGAGPAAADCEAKAIDKNGKPLAGAAKASFVKKCQRDASSPAIEPSCEAKAVDKNGKPLAGAAKASFVKKCEKDAAPKPAATDKPAAK